MIWFAILMNILLFLGGAVVMDMWSPVAGAVMMILGMLVLAVGASYQAAFGSHGGDEFGDNCPNGPHNYVAFAIMLIMSCCLFVVPMSYMLLKPLL